MDARAQREVVSGPEADDIRFAKRKAAQQWYSRNNDKRAANKRRYYQNNREKCIAAAKLYYAKNKQKMKEAHKRWVEANRQQCREYNRQWRAKNQTKIKKAQREYRVKNRNEIREKNQEYHRKNRNAILEKTREYYVKSRNAIVEKQRKVYECRVRGKTSLAPVESQTPRTPPPRDADATKKWVKPSKKKWGYQGWGCKQRTCTNCGKVITNSNYAGHMKRCRASRD